MYLEERCKLSKHVAPCDHGFTQKICGDILCPGMFKCKDYLCIHLSTVCDGQPDCLHGDDEKFCTSLVCPGFLKCRGEMRCVGLGEVCDGLLDCLYSFDDELICKPCPESCECEGYVIVCFWNTPISSTLFSKALQMTGHNSTFYIDNSYFNYILYITVSACSLHDINFISTLNVSDPRLLFLNVSYNHLVSLFFFKHYYFDGVLTLDASQNAIYYVNTTFYKLNHLNILYISGNPLNTVTLKHTVLIALYLKQVSYNGHISVTIPRNCEVIVSDSNFCCVFPPTTICFSTNAYTKCFGLLDNMYSKCIFYVFTSLAFVIFFIMLLKINRDKPWVKSNKKYYIFAKFNLVVSDLLSISYLVVLVAADLLSVNVILWRQKYGCIFLRMLISVNLHCSILFKTLSLIIVVLKIVYPFRHQLRNLKLVPIGCILIWVVIFLLQTLIFIIIYGKLTGFFLDELCSCFDCHKNMYFIQLLPALIDMLCILVVEIATLAVYRHLKQKQSESAKMLSIKKMNIIGIIFKIQRPIAIEFAFRFTIFSLGLSRYILESFTADNCFSIILYLLPLNLIVTSLLIIVAF